MPQAGRTQSRLEIRAGKSANFHPELEEQFLGLNSCRQSRRSLRTFITFITLGAFITLITRPSLKLPQSAAFRFALAFTRRSAGTNLRPALDLGRPQSCIGGQTLGQIGANWPDCCKWPTFVHRFEAERAPSSVGRYSKGADLACLSPAQKINKPEQQSLAAETRPRGQFSALGGSICHAATSTKPARSRSCRDEVRENELRSRRACPIGKADWHTCGLEVALVVWSLGVTSSQRNVICSTGSS